MLILSSVRWSSLVSPCRPSPLLSLLLLPHSLLLRHLPQRGRPHINHFDQDIHCLPGSSFNYCLRSNVVICQYESIFSRWDFATWTTRLSSRDYWSSTPSSPSSRSLLTFSMNMVRLRPSCSISINYLVFEKSKLIQKSFSRQCDQLRGVFERRVQERGQRQSRTGGSHLPCLCLSFGVSFKVFLAQYVILSVSESTSQKEVVIFFLFASLLEFSPMYL